MNHCSFLVRVGDQGVYNYLVVERDPKQPECAQNAIALYHWLNQHSGLGITAANFKSKVKEHKLETTVWVKFTHMVSVVEQQFVVKPHEVRTGTVQIIAEPARTLMEPMGCLR